jgi:transaldolase
MKFFLDSGNVDEMRTANSWGILDGVTTNPTLAAKEGRTFRDLIEEIASIVDGPVSAETVSLDVEGMVAEARAVTSWAPNIVAKIPMTANGLAAVHQLSQEGVATNVTLVFSTTQGLMAAKAGAVFVSPFLGRLDDISTDGMQVVRDLAEIFMTYGYEAEVLAASIRHPLHVIEAARAGADIATMPFKVMEQMIHHPLTDAGLERFLTDWKKVPNYATAFELDKVVAGKANGSKAKKPVPTT